MHNSDKLENLPSRRGPSKRSSAIPRYLQQQHHSQNRSLSQVANMITYYFVLSLVLIIAGAAPHLIAPIEAKEDSAKDQNTNSHQQQQQPPESHSPKTRLDYQRLADPYCMLGNDSYQLGEIWNPTLIPFGVQVCVQCECILKKKKSCYEAKVTCRRITDQCPIIDSCPDANEKPIILPGECCKSCQTTKNLESDRPSEPSSSNSYSSSAPITSHLDKMNYKNERIKEYQPILKTLPACEKQQDPNEKQQQQQAPSSRNSIKPSSSSNKGAKNDLNAIRLAFKTLHSQNNHIISTSQTKNRTQQNQSDKDKMKPIDDNSRLDQQHPNDVQSGSGSNSRSEKKPQSATSPQPPNTCMLGSEIFNIGDIWNPYLPGFGVQTHVQCNCIVRQRKGRFETRPVVTCNRLNSGRRCKSCDERDA